MLHKNLIIQLNSFEIFRSVFLPAFSFFSQSFRYIFFINGAIEIVSDLFLKIYTFFCFFFKLSLFYLILQQNISSLYNVKLKRQQKEHQILTSIKNSHFFKGKISDENFESLILNENELRLAFISQSLGWATKNHDHTTTKKTSKKDQIENFSYYERKMAKLKRA